MDFYNLWMIFLLISGKKILIKNKWKRHLAKKTDCRILICFMSFAPFNNNLYPKRCPLGVLLRDYIQISLLALSQFKQTTLYSPLKSSEKHRFSGHFTGNRSWLICYNSLLLEAKFGDNSLIYASITKNLGPKFWKSQNSTSPCH